MKSLTSIIKILITAGIISIIGFMPLPYILEKSVPAKNAADFIEVDSQQESKSGRILLSAVGVTQARVFTALLALLPDYSLEPEVDYIVPDNYYEKHDKAAEQESDTITSSQINALQVAYRAANKQVEIVHKKIYVEGISQDSDFIRYLKSGDQILKIDNQIFTSPYDIIDKMEQKKVGDIVTVEYNRNGVIGSAQAPLIVDKSTAKAGLGIDFYSQTGILLYPNTTFKTNGVAGSSGGLMFSLEIYNQLMPTDLTKGHTIAGTGTIDHKGNVGRISGVEKKVLAADRAGASVFFVPDDTIEPEIAKLNPKLRSNYHEALRAAIRIKSKMKIVPVKTFNDAVAYLNDMK